jgi:tetratricopeptide (TPR) repeat protein
MSLILLYLLIKQKNVAGFGLIWFLVALLPGIYISLSKGYRLPGADRFLYSALPGLTFLISLLCFKVLRKKAAPLLIMVILICIPFSFQRANVWLNAYNLWKDANSKCGEEWAYPLTNLANAALTSGHIDESEVLCEKIVQGFRRGSLKTIYAEENGIGLIYVLTYLGTISEIKHDEQKAEKYFSIADEEYSRFVKQYPKAGKREMSSANYILARFYFNKSLRENNKELLTKALEQVDLAIKYRATLIEAHRLKAYILFGMGRCKDATDFLRNTVSTRQDKDLLSDLLKFERACRQNYLR